MTIYAVKDIIKNIWESYVNHKYHNHKKIVFF